MTGFLKCQSFPFFGRTFACNDSQCKSSTTSRNLAIGIGHDVGKYYDNAITINNAETLGETLLEKLTDLLNKS